MPPGEMYATVKLEHAWLLILTMRILIVLLFWLPLQLRANVIYDVLMFMARRFIRVVPNGKA